MQVQERRRRERRVGGIGRTDSLYSYGIEFNSYTSLCATSMPVAPSASRCVESYAKAWHEEGICQTRMDRLCHRVRQRCQLR